MIPTAGAKYTDELTPHMEWLTEKKVLATRDISSNSAGETEELIERQEKVIDQLDKKGKVITRCYTCVFWWTHFLHS